MDSNITEVDIKLSNIRVALITNISNIEEVRHLLVDGSLSVCLLNVKLVLDLWQIQVAAYKAYVASLDSSLSTKTLHSEILYNLFPHRQISQAYKTFGVQSSDTCCVAVTIGENSGQEMKSLLDVLHGAKVVPFYGSIASFHDIDAIKKMYKIQEEELNVGTLSDAVGSRIAAKDIVT